MAEENLEKSIDIKRVLAILLSRWYIIVASIIIALVVSYIKLRYTTPIYQANIYLRLEDEKNSGITDLFRFGRSGARLDNQMKTETEVIRSRTVALKTLQALDIPFTYEFQGKILKQKLYPNNIFVISPIYIDSSSYLNFTLVFTNKISFDIFSGDTKKNYQIGDTVILGGSSFIIKPHHAGAIAAVIGVPIRVSQNDVKAMSIALANAINVETVKGTSLFNLSIESDMPQFAVDYINKLAEVYIKEQVINKAQTNEQTLAFIATQLNNFGKELQTAEEALSGFKASNKGVSPDELGKIELSKLITLETEKNLKQLALESLEKAIKDVQMAKDKPVEMIILDADLMGGIGTFQSMLNSLIIERISLVQRYGPESKILQENSTKIENAKEALLKSLFVARNKLADLIKNISNRIDDASSQLGVLPEKQLNLINLERNYKVNEKIFSYLLEKRLETMIQRASIVSNTSIVDPCLGAGKIFPNDKEQYTLALGIALLLSIGLILLLRLIYDRITDKETIEQLSKTPVIGIIKRISETTGDSDYNIHALTNPKSIFSESIRGIRTSLNFILQGNNHKLISVTSTVSGEGKTFCTLNIAASLTLLGNKVVIIGCDLRRPKLHLSFPNMTNKVGLTTYLIGKTTKEESILATPYEKLFIVPAGPVPPNPSELLQSDKMLELLENLKHEFDYVLLDTSPVGLVADSLTLMQISDVNLYILRANYSKRDFALVPDRIKADNGIKNLYSILNAFDPGAGFYGSIYKQEYGGYYGGGGYYYYGGYYGRSSYGYYGRKYNSQYYSGYYTDEDMNGKRKGIVDRLKKLIKK
jgi:capsular exopolysaccharide synthesis family protein